MIAVEQALRRDFAAGDDLAQRIEETRLVVSGRVDPLARGKPSMRDVEDLLSQLLEGAAARPFRRQAELGHLGADAVMILDRPVLDLIPCGIERTLIIKQPDPESGERADAVPLGTSARMR